MKISNSSRRLQELMSIMGITQTDICIKTNLTKSVVSMYVNGKREPRQDKISQICEAYNLDPAWLMGYDVPMFKETLDDSSAELSFLINEIKNNPELPTLIKRYLSLPDSQKALASTIIKSMLESGDKQ